VLMRLGGSTAPELQECREGAGAKLIMSVLHSLAAARRCSLRSRPVMELLHVSKSGGTSMCDLASHANRSNPGFDVNSNCLIPDFHDDPRWVWPRPPWVPSNLTECPFWVVYECSEWLGEQQVTCVDRQRHMAGHGWDFYANEHALHGSSPDPASAHVCPAMQSVIVVREPLARTHSHLVEMRNVFHAQATTCTLLELDAYMHYQLPPNITLFRELAPAVVDNYLTRSLLGRHAHCRPFGTLALTDLHHAALKLLSFDHLLVLPPPAATPGADSATLPQAGVADSSAQPHAAVHVQQDASLQLLRNVSAGRLLLEPGQHVEALELVMRGGMGWPHTLSEVHDRRSLEQGMEAPGSPWRFPPGSAATLLTWNQLDAQLHALATATLALDTVLLRVEQAEHAKHAA